ncbi:RDD family protein [Brevibacillus reuszeri]|uniref:RDD family protein n=1 Tax=Brevibacillus reuszeri TaxID=54915 RepID=UPI0028A08D96|nr:RDD family protein [Brevibacillus reuszeri]
MPERRYIQENSSFIDREREGDEKGMNDWTQMNQATREASVVTPEHVMLRFQTAGVGSRATAQLIDMVLLFLVNITVFILFSIAFFGNNNLFFLETENYALAIALLFIFVLNFGYYLFLEAFWGGQTVGKRLLGIRVIRDNGQPITFLSSTIRNLFRIIDMLPTGYFLGAMVSLFHPRDKRIGDLVAGTIVVMESGQTPSFFQKKRIKKLQEQAGLESFSLSEAQKQAITREDWQLLSTFISRLSSLTKEKKQELGQQIAATLSKKLDMEDVPMVKENPLLFLQGLYNQLQNEWKLGK